MQIKAIAPSIPQCIYFFSNALPISHRTIHNVNHTCLF